MKFLVLVFVQLLVVHIAWSAVFDGGNYTHPDHPGKCYYEKSDPPTILVPGDTVTIKGQCVRASCHDDFSMRFTSCPTYDNPGEDMPEDRYLPYPECCPGYRQPLIYINP